MATVDSLVVKRPARELAMGDWVALFQKDSGAFSGWFMIVAPWKNDDVIGIAADGSTTRIGCTADELLDVWCGIGQPSSPVAPAPLPLPRDRRLEADIAESTRAALCTPGRAAETIAALCTRVWNRARKELEVELTETRKQHAHAWTRVNAGVEVLEADLAAEKKAVADLTAALRSIEGTHDATCKSLESEILQLKTQLGLSRLKAATEAEKTPKEEVAPPKDPPYESLDPVRYHAIAAYEAERNRQGSPIAQPADAAKALLGALVNPMAAAVFRDRDKEVFFAAFILGYRKATSVWEDEKGEKTAPKTEPKAQSNKPPWGVKRHINLPLSSLPTQPGWGVCRVWERWSRQFATHEYYVAVPPEGVDMPEPPAWLSRIFAYAREQGAEGVLFDSCSTTKKDPYTSPL